MDPPDPFEEDQRRPARYSGNGGQDDSYDDLPPSPGDRDAAPLSSFGGTVQPKTYPVQEAGDYVCKFVGVFPSTKGKWGNKDVKEPSLKFVFETIDPNDFDEDGKPVRFSKNCRKAWGDRADLTRLVESMVGRSVTFDEFETLNPADLQRINYRLLIGQGQGDNSAYNYIDAISRVRQPVQRVPAGDGPPKNHPPTGQVRPARSNPVAATREAVKAGRVQDAVLNRSRPEPADLDRAGSNLDDEGDPFAE